MGKVNRKIPGHTEEFRGMAQVCRKYVGDEIEKSIFKKKQYTFIYSSHYIYIKYLTSIPLIGILLHTCAHANMHGHKDKALAFKKPTIQ